MIIQPSIRGNVFTNAHPLGCQQTIKNYLEEVSKLSSFKGPKNVLIIGGSSGYGLASRIALAFKGGANTLNISFESAPKGKRTGTAGWWNNIYFQQATESLGTLHKDFVGDAFSQDFKDEVVQYIKETFGKIDLVIYSLAAGARKHPTEDILVRSAIKTLGEPAEGETINVAKESIEDLVVEGATDEEVKNTVFVMGGEDWEQWIQQLAKEELLATSAKTISYTYIGGPTTARLYRDGTLGKAKEDLEETAKRLDRLLSETLQGEALISSSKAVVTKASVFIPQMPIYVSCLFDVMMEAGVHESIIEHKHRLFASMVYGEHRRLDDEGRIRLDHLEMDEDIQTKTAAKMKNINEKDLFDMEGTKQFLKDFYQIHGFQHPNINYETSVDLESLEKLEPK